MDRYAHQAISVGIFNHLLFIDIDAFQEKPNVLRTYPNKTSAQRPARCTGDCPCALSVSVLRVWLGQDRLSGVLASGAMLGSEWHPIPQTISCQQKKCNFSTRSKKL